MAVPASAVPSAVTYSTSTPAVVQSAPRATVASGLTSTVSPATVVGAMPVPSIPVAKNVSSMSSWAQTIKARTQSGDVVNFFDLIDVNKDGNITKTEMQNWRIPEP